MSVVDASEWASTVDAFRHACDHAAGMICSEPVAARWAEPSALPGFTVGGIAGHLLGVLRAFDRRVDLVVSGTVEMVSPVDRYAAVRLVDATCLDEEAFRVPREAGERFALKGQPTLCEELRSLVDRLDARLRVEQADRVVALPDATKATTLLEYTRTRIVEMVVHADDLASSVGVVSDRAPSDAAEITVDFLIAAVRSRIGEVAMLRSLAGRGPADDLRAL